MATTDLPTTPSDALGSHWDLDPDVTHLNHASYGACPRKVLAMQSALRAELEAQPGAFYAAISDRLAQARSSLGAFVGAEPDRLAFTTNVTVALNAVIGSLELAADDEILVTTHEYNATRNVAVAMAERAGARCVVADVPFVGVDEDAIVDAVLARATSRTRAAVLDHVTSQTGLVFPLARLIEVLEARGIAVIVDGAHAPGMLDLDVEALAPSWYTGNCHKWLCAPKSAGFLWAREDRVAATRSAIVSHGASLSDPHARFRAEFDWPGTIDPTAALSVPAAIEHLGTLLPGGWDAVRSRNHDLAVEGRALLCDALEIDAPCPDTLLGSMATLPLPELAAFGTATAQSAIDRDPVRATLLERFAIEVPVFRCDAHPGRLFRVSAALYNSLEDYVRLAEALRTLVAA